MAPHPLPHRHGDHALRHRVPAEQRGDAHAEPGGDHPELCVRLGGPVADDRLDALGAQGEHQPLVAELALVPGDPLVVGELREIHLPTAGQPVPGRHGHIGRVVQERGLDQPVRQRHRLVVPVQDDREVEIPADHPGDAGLRFQLAGAQPERGVPDAQPGERRREQPARRRGERRQTQLPDHAPPLGLQIGAGQLDLGEDARGVLGEQPPGVGQPYAPPVLGEQPLADLALQLGELLRDGRGRHVQPFGGGADGAVPGEGVEGAQALQVQHVSDATRYRASILDCATRSTARGWPP